MLTADLIVSLPPDRLTKPSWPPAYDCKWFSKSNLIVKYDNFIDVQDYTEEEIREKLRIKYKNNFKRELSQGNTLYGPHRDDFAFYIDDDNLKIFSSPREYKK